MSNRTAIHFGPEDEALTHRVDYDTVAEIYDEPLRDHVVDPDLLDFLDARKTVLTPPVRILDVGCGTGKQLAANRTRCPVITMVGVDRFQAMLRIAQKRCPAAAWVQADGARLPLSSGAFHYVTNQFSYPHVRRTRQLLTEAFRVLEPGGRFVMTNIDPWSMTEWILYQYFPEALEVDRQDFVEVDRFVMLMRDVGFESIRVRREDLSKQESVADFFGYASSRHRASQLMVISDAAYAAGLRRLETALGHARGQDIVVRSQFVLVNIAGDKPVRERPCPSSIV